MILRTPMAAVTTTRSFAAALRQEPTRPGVAEPDAARDDAVRPATAYRTFSAKLAPGLQAAGGAMLVAGGLGLHLRATRIAAQGLGPEEVLREWGHASGAGWLIAVVGVAAVVAALAWPARRIAWKAAPVAAAAAGIGLAAWRLQAIDARAAGLVASTEPSTEFVSFHAGFGWGAWFLLLGATLLALAVLAGLLRELDLRREGRG